MIDAASLTRSYGEFKAVDDVSFSIDRGEVVGLLGHNGAGKTTIMKMLTGYLEPDSGCVTIDGMDVTVQRRDVQRRIGYLPENCPLYPEMTVIDYLDYQAALHGISSNDRPAALREAIERTALQAKAAAAISTLSRGYRQRVGVAQALLHHPQILILDEPTNGLDPSQIQHMRGLLREVACHATVIVSTHILQEVDAVCDRVLILRNGRLALDARLPDLESSSRLLVELNEAAQKVEGILGALGAVREVQALEARDGRRQYALSLDGSEPGEAAPSVARAVFDAGWSLYALQPERRDLESVFAEINRTESQETAHA